jgi:hypothetical protein
MTNLPGFIKITEFILQIETCSEANSNEHWRKKAARHKLQKQHVKLASFYIPKELPVHIKLTRISRKMLDKHDNLPCSLKYILDAVCEQITGNLVPGQADNDPRLSFEYDQEKGSLPRVKFEFFRKNNTLNEKPIE